MTIKRTRDIGYRPFNLTAQIWTVVSLVDDRICCTIHSSEHLAYREAVSRFESAELGGRCKDTQLSFLLEAATTSGDYQEVRKYIQEKSCRLHLLQLAEHDVTSLSGYQVRARRTRPRIGGND
jgi:hypothetical protein